MIFTNRNSQFRALKSWNEHSILLQFLYGGFSIIYNKIKHSKADSGTVVEIIMQIQWFRQ